MTEVRRNFRGQPLITPPGGGTPVPYNRASSFGDVLDDEYHLNKWYQRMVARGIAERADLRLAVLATPPEDKSKPESWNKAIKKKLNDLIKQAIEHAGGSRASTTGTALHGLTELIDLDEPLPVIPPEYEADLAAYRAATARYEMVHVEPFVVCDELKAAGSPDRFMNDLRVPPHTEQRDGHAPETVFDPLITGDLKTSARADFLFKHCVQLAIYSRSVLYDPATGERTPIDVDQDRGVIFHMPVGKGQVDLYELDLQAGWEGALLAADVRKWRARKGILTPIPASTNYQEAAA